MPQSGSATAKVRDSTPAVALLFALAFEFLEAHAFRRVPVAISCALVGNAFDLENEYLIGANLAWPGGAGPNAMVDGDGR